MAVCGAGDLAHTVSVALFLNYTFFPFSSSGHWLVVCASAAVVLLSLGISAIIYPPLTLLQEGIHGFRDIMLLAIGTFYLLSYRTVGLRFDGNLCPYLLSPTAPAPRTRCLGHSVARFATLFWSLFGALFGADFLEPTWSRELYNQLATQPGPLGCIPPTDTLQATPRPLKRATEACFAPRKGLNSRGSFSSPQLDAFLTCLKAKNNKLYAIFLYAFNFPGTFERLSYYYCPLC